LQNPENEEVAGGAAVPFEPETLAETLQWAVGLSEDERSKWRSLARLRVEERYSWDAVTDQYERLFTQMTGTSK
jgi:glycosyltransferase involved in cell wall biosynthesis